MTVVRYATGDGDTLATTTVSADRVAWIVDGMREHAAATGARLQREPNGAYAIVRNGVRTIVVRFM